MSRLNVINNEKPRTQKEQYEENVIKALEKQWREGKLSKFDPTLTAEGRLRVFRTTHLLKKHVSAFHETDVVDFGCGTGVISSLLAADGARITAIDALVDLKGHLPGNVHFHKAILPFSNLQEESASGLVLTEVVAEIDPAMHRLLFSEAAAVLKKAGWMICSTTLDLYSIDPLHDFLQLAETEFKCKELCKSFHRLYFYIRRFLQAPERFLKAFRDKAYKKEQLQKRKGAAALWLHINSSPPFAWIWGVLARFSSKIAKRFLESDRIILILERISEVLWGDMALTHIIIFAQKKSM